MTSTPPVRHGATLPPVNLRLIDNSGAFKKQAESTRRHFRLTKTKKAKADGK